MCQFIGDKLIVHFLMLREEWVLIYPVNDFAYHFITLCISQGLFFMSILGPSKYGTPVNTVVLPVIYETNQNIIVTFTHKVYCYLACIKLLSKVHNMDINQSSTYLPIWENQVIHLTLVGAKFNKIVNP